MRNTYRYLTINRCPVHAIYHVTIDSLAAADDPLRPRFGATLRCCDRSEVVQTMAVGAQEWDALASQAAAAAKAVRNTPTIGARL